MEGFRIAERVSELNPDVVVIDMGLAGMSGFGAGEDIKIAALGTKIIYMTVAPDFDLAAEAFRRGAMGLVDKTKFPEELLIAVRRAVRGRRDRNQMSVSVLRTPRGLLASGYPPRPTRRRTQTSRVLPPQNNAAPEPAD